MFKFTLLTLFVFYMTPSEEMNLNSTLDNYELICQLQSGDNIPVFKYKSKSTGLYVVIAQVKGPLVSGYFTLATEAQDDDGLPHTLEHLVFLGSEDYPYKGVLDLLANRCLASGTNAWTDTDHTAYTVQTAGSEGFLNLLPIYLDHLIYPTLTDSAFTTEVYHITGDAEDAGVVYSEMQASENTDVSVSYLNMIREMYPAPSGYRYETGGIMQNLRESINNEKIKKFHSDFYRPENLHIIITGQVEPIDVFKVLKPFEDKIINKGERSPYTRPWESVVPRLEASVDKKVLYPSDSEDNGLVTIGWRGPSAVSQPKEMMSVNVLNKYLTDSSISPLPKIFVEADDPLASTVYSSYIENSISCLYLMFFGVPTDKVDSIKPLLDTTLINLTTGELEFKLDVMKDILKNLILKEKSKLESSPHDSVAGQIIGDALYGYTPNDLDIRLNKRALYEDLLTKPETYWLEMIKTYLIDSFSVTIRGIPSIEEAARIQKEQEERVAKRKKDVGPTGLQQWKEILEKAKEQNEIPPPTDMLNSVPVPGIDNINFHDLSALNNLQEFESTVTNAITTSTTFDFESVPIKFQLDQVQSNFVQLIAILDTSTLAVTRRPYLPLLLDLFLESPVFVDDNILSHEEVIEQLAADTIKSAAIMGLKLSNENNFACGTYCNNAIINLKMDIPNYSKGVEWLRRVLFNLKLDPDRIRVKANRLLNSIGEHKRSGRKNLDLLHNDITFDKNSNKNQINFHRQQKFLKCTIERLEREPEAILKELQEVVDTITDPDQITIHMSTDIDKLSKIDEPTKVWRKFLPQNKTTNSFRLNTLSESDMRSVEDFEGVTGFLTGIGSVESGYILQSTPCLAQYMHWDLPALLTAIQYLTQLEGPMWKEIRGKGLAYHYGLELKPSEGTLYLRLAKAAQPAGAYAQAINILESHINGTREWEKDLLSSARSSLIFEVIEREAQISDVIQQSILAYFRKVPHSYNRDLLQRINEVTIEDVSKVAEKYFTPLIDPNTSKISIVCHPSKAQEILQDINTKFGHNLQFIEDIAESRFSAW